MSKIKSNYEIISDKENDIPVTSTEYIKHGDKWLDDEISKLAVTNVYSETDFMKDSNVYILMQNIEVTHSLPDIVTNKSIDLNGYAITLSDDFSDDYVAKINVPVTFGGYQRINNGIIDCNNKNCAVFLVNQISNTKISDIVVKNCIKGLFTYDIAAGLYAAGANVTVENVTVNHGSSIDTNIGIDIQFGDSSVANVQSIGFYTGCRVTKGSNNVLHNVHPWGLPRTSTQEYPDSKMMRIGFAVFGAENRFISCVADTFEPIDINANASYENGGIGFYINTNSVVLNSCYGLVHKQSDSSKHIYYYFDDVNPKTGGNLYLNTNTMIGCYVSLNEGQIVKGTGLYITEGRENTLSIIDCILSTRTKQTKIRGEIVSTIGVYSGLKDDEIETFKVNGTVMQHYKMDGVERYSTLVPNIDSNQSSYSNLTGETNAKLKGKQYPIQLFTVGDTVYLYEPIKNRFGTVPVTWLG